MLGVYGEEGEEGQGSQRVCSIAEESTTVSSLHSAARPVPRSASSELRTVGSNISSKHHALSMAFAMENGLLLRGLSLSQSYVKRYDCARLDNHRLLLHRMAWGDCALQHVCRALTT